MKTCTECGQNIYEPPAPIDLTTMTFVEQRELHRSFSHPNYDYCIAEVGRKSSECDYPKDMGTGWIINPKVRWERFDYTEETHWMRLKSKQNTIEPVYESSSYSVKYDGPFYDEDAT